MTSLPAEVEVVEVPDGAYRARRYRLPRRTMPGVGCTIYSGIFALTLAVGFPLGVALFGLSIAAGDRWEFKLAAFLCPLCFFGSLLFPAALYVLLRIVFVHLGRIEIVVTRERLLIAQRWGFLGWTRRLPLRGLRGLRVITDRPFNPQDPHFSQQLSQVGNLLADYEGGRKRTLCWGYPAEWLAQLGTVVTEDISQQPELERPPLPVTLVPADPTTIIARNSQPSDSTALVRNDGDQLVIDLPRPSRWRSVHFAFLMFCLVWNGLLTLFTCLFTIAAFAGKIQSDDPAEQAPIWVLVLFLIPFYLIGGVSLTYWIGMSRRWARIVLSAETLQVTDHKLWKTTTTEWPADQIVAVRALSQKHENDEEVTWSQGLLIEPLEGVPLAFLEWRPKSELEWLATTLCQALKLPGI